MVRVKDLELQRLPLFEGMDPSDVEALLRLGETRTYPTGTVLFGQGDPADRLYILTEGRAAIRFKPHDGETLTVAEIQPGGVFGWSAALGRRTYTSGAVCLEDARAFSLRGESLRHLCETHPETGVVILERLAQVIAERLCSTHEQVVELLRLGMQNRTRT
jgi:CRP/FNR family cyclic AMP-dependent transcriptional regulator